MNNAPQSQRLATHRGTRPGVAGLPNRSTGFTLIELMVGIAVGLLATLVIANVMKTAEGFKRSSTSGSDAQINGGLSIYAVQRQLKMAGYGMVTESAGIGCALSSSNAAAALPPVLAPVLITAGVGGLSDSLRILSSSKMGFALPARVISPFYDPNDTATDKARRIAVPSSLGTSQGDLMALVYPLTQTCQVFQANAAPGLGQIARVDGGAWNGVKFPDTPADVSTYVVNLGTFSDISFSVTADYKLRQTVIDHGTGTSSNQDMQSNIVVMKALYGKDTNGDDVVDTYDTVTPANNAAWLQVRAVRIVVLARSAQFEKEEVTTTLPTWDLGSAATVTGSDACGSSRCITLHAEKAGDDWKHYRYKTFDALVPLRNQVWRSDFTSATLAPTP